MVGGASRRGINTGAETSVLLIALEAFGNCGVQQLRVFYMYVNGEIDTFPSQQSTRCTML